MLGMSGSLAALAVVQGLLGNSYRMELELHPEAGRLDGRMQVTYVNDTDEDLQEIHFRLDPNLDAEMSLDVKSVEDPSGNSLEHRPRPLEFGRLSSDRAALQVVLAEPLEPGASTEFELEFVLTSPRVSAAS